MGDRDHGGSRVRRRHLVAVGLAIGLLLGACGGVESTSSEGGSGQSSLEGETIEFVVPYEPGGGYDIYARLIAPYLEECSGATVVVRNEPGAGGLLATSKTYVSPPDELRILITNTVGIVGAQLAEAEGVQFEVENFAWLGRVSTEPNVIVVANDSDIKSFEDLLAAQEPVSFAATGPGSNEYINSTVIPRIYDFPSTIIAGFASGDDARAALVAGEVDAHIQPLDSQISAIESGDLRPILLISRQPSELIPDTPTLNDFEAETADGQLIMDSLLDLTESGRGVVASPNLEEGLRAPLEEALDCALQNEELVAEVKSQQRSIKPLSASDMDAMIDDLLNLPAEFQDLVREAS